MNKWIDWKRLPSRKVGSGDVKEIDLVTMKLVHNTRSNKWNFDLHLVPEIAPVKLKSIIVALTFEGRYMATNINQ